MSNPYRFRITRTTSPDYSYLARIDTTLRDGQPSQVFSAIGTTETDATDKLRGLIEGSPWHPVGCKREMVSCMEIGGTSSTESGEATQKGRENG